nr:unnamed protein product [Callosobruchus chinensis]
MIWHEHVSSIATAAGKKLGYLFRARKYFSPSNLLTLYKAQIRPSLEYCSHIWGAAAPTTLSILDTPLSHRRAVGDLSLFYRYSNGFCSSQLTSIIPPLSKPARCTRGTSSSHPKAVVLHTSRTERYDRTFIPRVSRAWNGLLVMYLMSRRELDYSSLASTSFLNLTFPQQPRYSGILGSAFAVCSVIKKSGGL